MKFDKLLKVPKGKIVFIRCNLFFYAFIGGCLRLGPVSSLVRFLFWVDLPLQHLLSVLKTDSFWKLKLPVVCCPPWKAMHKIPTWEQNQCQLRNKTCVKIKTLFFSYLTTYTIAPPMLFHGKQAVVEYSSSGRKGEWGSARQNTWYLPLDMMMSSLTYFPTK